MNIGILTRLKILSGSIDELISYAKKSMRSGASMGQTETAFYLSAEDSQVFYVLSLWSPTQNLSELEQALKTNLLEILETRAQLQEQHIFRLKWDYRLLPHPIVVSNLRIMTFPPDFSKERFDEIMESLRRQRETIPNITGMWAGVSIQNHYMILYRLDWNDKQAQQKLFHSEMLRNVLAIAKGAGIKIVFASSSLQGIIQPDDDPDTLILPKD